MKALFYTLLLSVCPFLLFGQSFFAMSYNIRYDNPNDGENTWEKRKEDVAKLIHYYQPDFLGTQEGLNHQLDFMRVALPAYAMIGVGREDGKEKGEYTAIFYDKNKYALQEQQTFWLSETEKVGSVGWDAALERICTYGVFKNKTNGQILYVFNAHFDHRGEQARQESAKLILKKIEALQLEDTPIILMGDFNSLPDSEAITTFNSGLKDCFDHAQKLVYGPIGTFNGFKQDMIMDRRIDYVFVRNLEVLSCRHIDDKRQDNYFISDHLPIYVELRHPEN